MVAERSAKIQKLVELGEAAHLLFRTKKVDREALLKLSQDIIDLEKTVNAPLGKLPPNRADGLCPNCGIACGGAAFCTGCGLNIDEFFTRPILVCRACGFMVAEEDVYCGICGSKREEQ